MLLQYHNYDMEDKITGYNFFYGRGEAYVHILQNSVMNFLDDGATFSFSDIMEHHILC
jgi:hypothetical protein